MSAFLGYPNQRIIDEIYSRRIPTPENVFALDENGNVVVDEEYIQPNGTVMVLGVPNEDGTLTLNFD